MLERIQLSRAKGWRMPPNTVKVDRSTAYGNPWRVGLFVNFTAQDAVDRFRAWIRGDVRNSYRVPDLAALRGKNLACWCKPGEPCHADVLLELANAPAAAAAAPPPDKAAIVAELRRVAQMTGQPLGKLVADFNALAAAGVAACRVLDASDPFCPNCGHNRDRSSVSSIDHGDGRHSCQKCGAEWIEPAPGVLGTQEAKGGNDAA